MVLDVRVHAAAPDRPVDPKTCLLGWPPAGPGRRAERSRALGTGLARTARVLLLDDSEHVTGREHQVLLARVLDLCAAVLAVQHDIAGLDVHGDALGASVIEPAWSDGDDLALLG